MTSQPYKIAEDKMRARLIKVKISFQFRDTCTPKIILCQRQNYISILITKEINKIRKIQLKQSEFDNHHFEQSLFSVLGFASTLIIEKVTKPHWLLVIK